MKIITAVLTSILCVAAVAAQDVDLGRSKPKQKSGPVVAPAAEAKAVEPVATPEQTPAATPMPSIKGHTLGEALDCSRMRPRKEVKQWKGLIRGGSKIIKPAEVCDPAGNWEEGSLDGPTLTYMAGKLVKIRMIFLPSTRERAFNNELLLAETVEKFGKPTKSNSTEMMNGFGARWQDQTFGWELSNGYVALFLFNNPAELGATLEVMTPEEHEVAGPAPKKLLD